MVAKYAGSKLLDINWLVSLSPYEYSEFRSPFAGNEPLLWVIPTSVKRWINDINPLVYQYWIALRDDDSLEGRWVRHCKRADRSLTDAYHLFRSCCKRLMTGNHHPVDLLFVSYLAVKQQWGMYRSHFASFSPALAASHSWRAVTPERIILAREIMQGVRVTNWDYQKVVSAPGRNCWIYCDPPYDGAGRVYAYGFSPLQRKDFVRHMLRSRHRTLISLEDSELTVKQFVTHPHFDCVPQMYRSRRTQKINRQWHIANYSL